MIVFEEFGLRDQGRVRDRNEDYFAIYHSDDEVEMSSRGRFYAVADGMGGHNAGELASRMAIETTRDIYYSDRGTQEPDELLKLAIEKANEAIYEKGQETPEYYKMGSTITAVAIVDERAYIAHVGDTRAYILRRGKVIQLTNDHNWAGEQLRLGLITKVHAETHPRRHVLTRALGQGPEVEVDTHTIDLEPDDLFLLCTDGLHSLVDDRSIFEVLIGRNPENACRELVNRANQNGGGDNICAIVVKTIFEGRPLHKRADRKVKIKLPNIPPLYLLVTSVLVLLLVLITMLTVLMTNKKKGRLESEVSIIGAEDKNMGLIKVSSTPLGAVILLDEREIGSSTPFTIKLPEGKHKLEVRLEGYQPQSKDIDVRPGKGPIPHNFFLIKVAATRKIPENMAKIPAGYFIMGSDKGRGDEGPAHQAYLDEYMIDLYEVSVSRYDRFIKSTGRSAPKFASDKAFNKSDKPVVGVSWEDAKAYCTWADKRLPTEAEWEKAARGAQDGRRYPWGNEFSFDKANLGDIPDGVQGLAGVKSFEPGKSPFGVHNMTGNVSEWVEDWYSSVYYKSKEAIRNPKGPDASTTNVRVLKGGSWVTNKDYSRLTYRHRRPPKSKEKYIGFRCVSQAE